MSRLTTNASASAWASLRLRDGVLARAADYLELTKPRIVALELVTVIITAHLAAPWGFNPWVLFCATVGAALVAASAGAVNQWWERATDARMTRTAHRPLPAGRLTSRQVMAFAFVTFAAGLASLALLVSSTTAVIALATWLVYVFAYTPLKSR